MADQPNAFTEVPVAPATPQAPSSNPFEDRLKQILNEDGKPKYDSLDKALEALSHSQQYIPQLKSELETDRQELARLREELTKRESVEDVVKRLTATQTPTPQAPGIPPTVAGLDEQAAKRLFEQMLSERSSTQTRETNQRTVNTALFEKFGDKTSDVVKAKALELGTTPTELGNLASQNPAMVLALFQTAPGRGPQPTTSSVNLPFTPRETGLTRPEKSLLAGSTSKEQAAYMRKIKEEVYRKHNITS